MKEDSIPISWEGGSLTSKDASQQTQKAQSQKEISANLGINPCDQHIPLMNLPLVVSHTLLLVYFRLSKTLPLFVPVELSSNLALISLPSCYNLDKISLAFTFVQGNRHFATSLDTLDTRSAVSGCFLVHQRNQLLVLLSSSAFVPCFFFFFYSP